MPRCRLIRNYKDQFGKLMERLARLLEAENGHERFIDSPLLLRANPAHKVSDPAGVDSSKLLNQDSGCLTQQVNLRAKRGGSGAVRRRGNEHYGAGQQLVCLDDHAVSTALLLVTSSAWRPELVNVTPKHACSP
jgi:hypothetical protein